MQQIKVLDGRLRNALKDAVKDDVEQKNKIAEIVGVKPQALTAKINRDLSDLSFRQFNAVCYELNVSIHEFIVFANYSVVGLKEN